jgi:hypothetical protein
MKKNISSFLAGNTAQQPGQKKKRPEPKQHEAETEYENEEEGYQTSLSAGSETTVERTINRIRLLKTAVQFS